MFQLYAVHLISVIALKTARAVEANRDFRLRSSLMIPVAHHQPNPYETSSSCNHGFSISNLCSLWVVGAVGAKKVQIH